MKRLDCTGSPFILCLAFFLAGPAIQAAEPISLFDGSTLEGWEGDPNHWRVEDGAIVGEIPKGQTLNKNTWLVWRGGTLKDFDLRVQVKLTGAPAANSGIQFRCQVDHIEHVSGYQADLDQGATWLGRIYDEHGRALLVERGSRVWIAEDGSKRVQTFAPANQYTVLFRENDWNDYRIVAIGDHIAVYVNGTLFSELKDQQPGELDLSGALAVQLHSGPETRVEFRNFQLEHLAAEDDRLGEFSLPEPAEQPQAVEGVAPKGEDGADLNLGFEQGNLAGWTASGDAFQGQPVNQDGIASRWPGQSSNKQGDFFIGGYEKVQDRGTGTLTSRPFLVSHPFASFLLGGGSGETTRVETLLVKEDPAQAKVIHQAAGNQREQMQRVVVDLRPWQGQSIAIRLVDENAGAWGHLNFDDFRFHEVPPVVEEGETSWRSIKNPLLQHLVPNPAASGQLLTGSPASNGTPASTLAQMFVPQGFSVDLIAAEPDLHQPMAFTFDVKGRLWVAEGFCYPQKRPEGEGLDRILIFTDTNGDGSFDQRQVFIEGLNLVSGMEVGHGGVWVGAAPELLFIPDRDGDDRPDGEPQVLLDGFGYADTHETMNSFLWGPDGWLYGNQGVFNSSRIGKPGTPDDKRQSLHAGVWRYHPTRHEFQVFAHGGSNQWGLDYDLEGQLFMTHCRSYWGRGATTHVIQGGHYWNQVNGGYAPFISPVAPSSLPSLRNYLLASARYGHGEGGAGKPGSRQVYGGHSHVGTMIYLGDNWPDQYRNHLFTHNLHGHQMNHQVNVRHAGGYRTVHAGYDPFFCADPQYIGVDLMVGPDGAVYFSDWYDPRHCHNPNVEQWDRGNGRVYRMKYDANYHPVVVDYSTATDQQLVAAQLHKNEWHGRAARLVMQQRGAAGQFSSEGVAELRALVLEHPSADRRLRALWSLHLVNQLDLELVNKLLADESEYVRAWTIQLAVESLPADSIADALQRLSEQESSLMVRRYLASAIPQLPAQTGWSLSMALAGRTDAQADPELTLMLWYAIANFQDSQPDQVLGLAEVTTIPELRNFILWYAAKKSPEGREAVAKLLFQAPEQEQLRFLELLELAVRGMRGQSAPSAWLENATKLYESANDSVRLIAESVGSVFGDQLLFDRMRARLASEEASEQVRQHALSILELDPSPQNLPLLLQMLDQQTLAERVIPMLMRFDDPKVAQALIAQLGTWPEKVKSSAMAVLVSRPAWANQILDAIESETLAAGDLTAFHARQIFELGDPALRQRLADQWGSLGQSSEARKAEIAALVDAYRSAPLWAYNGQEGAAQFKKLCAACHQPTPQGENVAPNLAGSGSKGIEYLVENILDPNAVIGRDFLARNVLTSEGLVVSGLIESETDSAVTLRTLTDTVTISKEDIEAIRVSPNSFMPEGLLAPLNDRERLELLKYLMSL